MNRQYNKGFSVVEVIIACSIISISVFALMSTAGKSIQVSSQSLNQTQAILLVEEGVEAVKSIRDSDWDSVSTNGSYYLFFDTNTNLWSLRLTSSGMSAPNGSIPNYPIDSVFTRIVTISSVNRDSNGDISSSGTEDDGTKKVTITTSWNKMGGTSSKSLSFYISNIFN